jgi:Phosphotransferase system, mannose/fructose/N-acetylgalactosamine-specific component IIB
MAIKQYRVDGRMLHGQVCTAYGRVLSINEYIVINEAVANDELQVSLLEMAAMTSYVRVVSPKEAYEIISNNDFEGTSTLIVFKEIDDAVELIELGLKIDAIQIGGMYEKKGRDRKQYDTALFADDNDIACFRKLEDAGVDLTFQLVPDYQEKKLSNLVKY